MCCLLYCLRSHIDGKFPSDRKKVFELVFAGAEFVMISYFFG